MTQEIVCVHRWGIPVEQRRFVDGNYVFESWEECWRCHERKLENGPEPRVVIGRIE